MIDFRIRAQVEEVSGDGVEPLWELVDLSVHFVLWKVGEGLFDKRVISRFYVGLGLAKRKVIYK